MKFAFCNELFENRPMAEVCAIGCKLGYHGVEIAPFTLSKNARDISPALRNETRRIVEGSGLEVVGLHWIFVGPEGLHLTTRDAAVWSRTRDYMRVLFDLCADLGGKVLVLGSPRQRSVQEGQTQEGAWKRAVILFEEVLDHAAERGVTLCIEPLSPALTNFINTVEEGVRMVREVAHPNFKVHLDVNAMTTEPRPVADVIRSVRVEDVGHFHVNDPNQYGPGMGDVDYAPIAEAIRDIGWDKWLSVEAFKYDDPEGTARKSIEYLKRFWPS